MIISLPWPDKRLSPNARLHWKAKVGPRQDARRRAGWLTVAAAGYWTVKDALKASEGPIPVRITFYPPDKRHRDDDNMIASFKAWRDGVADALGVDDRRFRPHYFFADPAKPGRVEVQFFPENSAGTEQAKNAGDCLLNHAESAIENGPETGLHPCPALTQSESEVRNG